MLLIETYVDVSPNRGLGLFASRDIPFETRYWIRNEVFDKIIMLSDINFLDPLAVRYVRRYGFLEANNNWYLCGDNARFSNHSDKPNSKNLFDQNGLLQFQIASSNIKAGEEILCDYREICLTCSNGVDFIIKS